MPIDAESTWIETVNNLPTVKSAPESIKALVDAVDTCVTGKAELTGIIGTVSYTFQKAIFLAGLSSLGPAPVTATGVAQFVQAWQSAAAASVMIVPPGSSFGSPSPATTFSVVVTTLLDPPSLLAACSALQTELLAAGAAPVSSYKDSKVGPALYKAFKLLSYTVTGINSIAPTPTPLVAPLCLLK